MWAFVDHGVQGTGETLALDLRPGKASRQQRRPHHRPDAALTQLPADERDQVLVRTDTGGASKTFLHHITDAGLQYSVGFHGRAPSQAAIETIPDRPGEPRSTVTATRARVPRSPSSPPGCRPRQTDPLASQLRPPGLAGRDAGHRPP